MGANMYHFPNFLPLPSLPYSLLFPRSRGASKDRLDFPITIIETNNKATDQHQIQSLPTPFFIHAFSPFFLSSSLFQQTNINTTTVLNGPSFSFFLSSNLSSGQLHAAVPSSGSSSQSATFESLLGQVSREKGSKGTSSFIASARIA